MFNHKLSSIPNQNYRVDTFPSIDQLNEMIDKARSMSGIKHNYLWEVAKDYKKFTLSLYCKEKSYEETDIDWWLHEENLVGTKMHWFHKTKDIAVIYPHILSAIGEKHPLHEETEAEKLAREQKDKPTSLGQRLKRSASSAELTAPPEVEPQEVTVSQEAGQQSTMRLMSGNLRSRPIAWLLQTAAQSELTGELKIDGGNETVIIQFGLGRPVHAASRNLVGTEAILDLFAWQDGNATFLEGKQPETASVQDSSDEILKQGSKMLESLGFLIKNGMNADSVLSRPPIGLSEEQLEQRLKDGFDYGFKIQRTFYRALDGNLSLREVGAQISLESSRLYAITVNFLKLGLILTPDGKSLREVATAASNEAFANAQAAANQALGQNSLKPPPGFFGGGGPGFGSGFGTGEMSSSVTGETSKPKPLTPPSSVFGAGMSSDTASSAHKAPAQPTPVPAPTQEFSAPQSTIPQVQEQSGRHASAIPPAQEQSGRQVSLSSSTQSDSGQQLSPAIQRDFFEVGVPKEFVPFSETSVRAVYDSLCDRQTGALTSSAFQYFLDREFSRAFRFSTEFSLLIFCMRLGGVAEDPNSSQFCSMPMASLAIATQSISQIKRDVDMFGHVGDKAFGLILPGVGTNQSMALVDRIVAELPKLAPRLGGKWPILHFGIAGVPQDARDLPTLVQVAQQAMIQAAEKNYTRIRCSEME